MPLEIIEFRADKFQLSKCNAQDFVLGKVRGKCVGGGSGGRHVQEGDGKDGGLKDDLIYLQ